MLMSIWHTLTMAFEAALAGMAEPWVIAVALALTTLLLEDLAIAAGVALATQGALSWSLSFGAVAGGIAIGDIGLYALGFAATRVPWLQRKLAERGVPLRSRLTRALPTAVLLARVIPGLRLVTYTACGVLNVPLLAFSLWVLLAVALWTGGLFLVSIAIGQALADHLGLPLPLAVALPIVTVAMAVPIARMVHQRMRRRLPLRPETS